MSDQQTFIEIELSELMDRAREQKAADARFVQCCAMRGEEGMLDLLYTFSDDGVLALTNYLLHIPAPATPAPEAATGKAPEDESAPQPAPAGPVIPSVGSLFPNAFMFENEMHDLFGVNVDGITIDFRGGFYHLHIPMPMAAAPEKPAKKAPARPAGR